MPESSLSVEMTGKEAKLFQSFQSVIAQAGKFEDSLDKSATAAKKLSKEERIVAREAKRAFEEARPPLEKYNQKISTLDGLLKKNTITQQEHNAAVRKAKGDYEQAGQASKKAFGPGAVSMVKNLAGALGLAGGLAGAVALVKAEYQNVIDRQRTAAMLAKNVAGAQETALMNLNPQTEDERDLFVDAVNRLAEKKGVSRREVYLRASPALSARGDLPVSAAMKAVEASLDYAPGDSATGMAASLAALDLARRMGTGQEQALGFLQSAGTKMLIADPQRQATNLAPALAGAMDAGASPRAAAALFATFTQGTGDITGESARTATINFAERMRGMYDKQLEDAAKALDKGKIKPAEFESLQAKATAWTGMSQTERMQQLRGDEELRTYFIANVADKMETRARSTARKLVTPGATAQMYDQFRADLPGPEAAGQQFRQGVMVRQGTNLQDVARFDRMMKTGVESLALQDPARAKMGIMREQFGPLLQQAGLTKINQRFSEFAADFQGGGTRVAPFIERLSRLEQEIRTPVNRLIVLGGEAGTQRIEYTPGKKEIEQAELLRKIVSGLREIEQNTRNRQPTLVPVGEDR